MTNEERRTRNENETPTIKIAAERPYCAKHSRAMLVIGGEKKCASCLKEQRDAEEKRG